MTIGDKISDEKLQYGINREAAKISAISLNKINKHQNLTTKEILPSDQNELIEQVTYFPLAKVFETQRLKMQLKNKEKRLKMQLKNNQRP